MTLALARQRLRAVLVGEVSGRRSSPSPLPVPTRTIDGVLHVGADPWFPCGTCDTRFDTATFEVCPVCATAAADIERQLRADLFAWALALLTPARGVH